jgi:hypothetical protein
VLGLTDDFDSLGTTIGHFFGDLAYGPDVRAANEAIVRLHDEGVAAFEGLDKAVIESGESFDGVRAKVLELTGSEHAANLAALEWKENQEGLTEATEEAANVTGTYGDKLDALKAAYDPATAAAKLNEEATVEKAKADEEAAEKADRHRTALDQVSAAMENQANKALDLVGGEFALRDAQRDAATAAEELDEVLSEGNVTIDEAQVAIDDAAEAQYRYAQAAGDARIAQMEANGQQVDARTKAQVYKEELAKLAENMEGPLRDAILGLIADLDAIPRNVNTTVTVTRQGDTGQQQGGNRAIGGPVRSGMLYEVAEGHKSELYHEGGRTYLIPGQDGVVEPIGSPVGVGSTAASGGAAVIQLSVSVDARGSTNPVEVGRKTAEHLAAWLRAGGDARILQQAMSAA